MVLALETTTDVCSVALLNESGTPLATQHLFTERPHAEKLSVIIQNLFENTNLDKKSLSAVILSEGPGSYTGLRIGTSVAKGICYALDIPLINVPTLQAMAASVRMQLSQEETNFYLIPLLDARRMEVYTAVYDDKLNEVSSTHAKVMEEEAFSSYFSEQRVFFLGDGVEKVTPTPQRTLLSRLQTYGS